MSKSSSSVIRVVVPPVYVTEQICDVIYDNGLIRRYKIGHLPLCLRERLHNGSFVWHDGDYMIIDLV